MREETIVVIPYKDRNLTSIRTPRVNLAPFRRNHCVVLCSRHRSNLLAPQSRDDLARGDNSHLATAKQGRYTVAEPIHTIGKSAGCREVRLSKRKAQRTWRSYLRFGVRASNSSTGMEVSTRTEVRTKKSLYSFARADASDARRSNEL